VKAGETTGIAAAVFSRVRRAHLGRLTIDRLMTILNRLDPEVDVPVSVRPCPKGEAIAAEYGRSTSVNC
jgi:predicted XRE-type DNA-binding protein